MQERQTLESIDFEFNLRLEQFETLQNGEQATTKELVAVSSVADHGY